MADTSAAIQAAHEVQAETFSPSLYKAANEWFFKAKHHYKFKDFSLAKECAEKAQKFAEQAELQSVLKGAKRSDSSITDPLTSMEIAPPPPPPLVKKEVPDAEGEKKEEEFAEPEGEFFESIVEKRNQEQKRLEEEAKKEK